jgi:hypothetical protein
LLLFRVTGELTMLFKRLLTPLLVAGATLVATPLAGCAGQAAIVVREDEPPPVRYERVEYRPGYVYIQGHWERRSRGWAWRPGWYERERPGYVYIEGRWRNDGSRHVWVTGQWRRSGVVYRDRRY